MKIAICLPSYAGGKNLFHRCLRHLHKPFEGGRLEGTTHVFETYGMVIDKARNTLVEAALNADPDISHLLWIDDDMTFPADALMRLLDHGKPFVGGLCHNRRPPYQPIVLRYHDEAIAAGHQRYGFVYHYPPNNLFEVDATGAAFKLVAREVYEKIGSDWYTPAEGLSEDLSFCRRVKNAGYPIYVDTGLQIGHITEVVVNAEFAAKNREYHNWDNWRPMSGTVAEGMPVASVIIPTYNQKTSYLKAAVLSACLQSVPVEVIVVDDGSDEPVTLDMLFESTDNVGSFVYLLRIIRHERNQGISAALNTGIEAMKTDWFCWLSSDDYFIFDKVERQLAACEQGGFKACFTGWESVQENEHHARVGPRLQFQSQEEQQARLTQQCAINGSTIMVHYDMVQAVGGFDETFKYSQDWDFMKRVGEKTFWYGIPEILVTRREGPHNLTAAIAADEAMTKERNAEDARVRG